ncbi:MAG: hypothetical protein ACREOU_08415 [Candidatus Eiseniibacteriota bacterium]
MSRSLRGPFTAALALILVPAFVSSASAALLDPSCSTAGPVIVGNASGKSYASVGALSSVPGYAVVLGGPGCLPLAGQAVELDFSKAYVRLFASQKPGTTVDCARQVLIKVTDESGVALFSPSFGGWVNEPSVQVTVDGVVLATVSARSTDMDADGTTGLTDLVRFSRLFLAESTYPDIDFNASGGKVDLADFAIFASEFLDGTSGAYCP